MPRRRRSLSADDKAVWRQLTDTVSPLSDTDVLLFTAPFNNDETGSSTHAQRRLHKTGHDTQGLPLTAPSGSTAPSPRISTSGRSPFTPLVMGGLQDMDKRTAQRLKGGALPIAARLDLHGLPAAAAQMAFEWFILTSHGRGHRMVLVITGKGQRSGQPGGVLKRELPHWLNLPHLRPLIVGTTPARPRDGGEGAVYVLLRRVRGEEGPV
jgi:DNA-nicking Smr family endonuclease